MLRTPTPYPPATRIESSPRVLLVVRRGGLTDAIGLANWQSIVVNATALQEIITTLTTGATGRAPSKQITTAVRRRRWWVIRKHRIFGARVIVQAKIVLWTTDLSTALFARSAANTATILPNRTTSVTCVLLHTQPLAGLTVVAATRPWTSWSGGTAHLRAAGTTQLTEAAWYIADSKSI